MTFTRNIVIFASLIAGMSVVAMPGAYAETLSFNASYDGEFTDWNGGCADYDISPTDELQLSPKGSLSNSNYCRTVHVEFDLGDNLDDKTINSASLEIDISKTKSGLKCEVREMSFQPSNSTMPLVFEDTKDGDIYASGDFCVNLGPTTITLNQDAIDELQNKADSGIDWVAYGFKVTPTLNSAIAHYIFTSIEGGTPPVLKLDVTEGEVPPDPPTVEEQIADLQRQIDELTNLLQFQPTYYMVYGNSTTIPGQSNDHFTTINCNEGDTAITGGYNINGFEDGINGVRLSNSVPTADGEGWYLRINNVAEDEAQFAPSVLCVSYP